MTCADIALIVVAALIALHMVLALEPYWRPTPWRRK